jgi:hypothetical protein
MKYSLPIIPVLKTSYVSYVNSLRVQFSVRIEVNRISTLTVRGDIAAEHTSLRKELKQYLQSNLAEDSYHIQRDTGYHGLFYTWFMNKEDAVAFALKFNGRVV